MGDRHLNNMSKLANQAMKDLLESNRKVHQLANELKSDNPQSYMNPLHFGQDVSERQFTDSMQGRQRIQDIEYIKWLNEYYDLINKRRYQVAILNGRNITGEIRADINIELSRIDGLLPILIRKLNSYFFFDDDFNRQFVTINESQHINETKNNVINWTQFANGLIQITNGAFTIILAKIGAAPSMGGTTFLVIAGSASLADGFNMIRHSLNDVHFSGMIHMRIRELYTKFAATEEQIRRAEAITSIFTNIIIIETSARVVNTATDISSALSNIGFAISVNEIFEAKRSLR